MKLLKHSIIYFLGFVVLIGLTSTFTSKEFIDQPSDIGLTGQNMIQMQVALNDGNISMTEDVVKEQEDKDEKGTEEEKDAFIEELEQEPEYKNGDKDPNIMQYQDALIQLEYLSGNPDGSFGDMTEWAILEFQKDEGLEETGILDLETKSALKSNAILEEREIAQEEEKTEVKEQEKSEDKIEDSSQDQQESSTDNNIIEHTVKSGETFSHISAQYNVSIESILEANNLSETSLIDVGQKLIIPQN